MKSELSEPVEAGAASDDDMSPAAGALNSTTETAAEPPSYDPTEGAPDRGPFVAAEDMAASDDPSSVDAPVTATTSRSRRRGILISGAGLVALLVLAGMIAWVHVSASRSFDAAGGRLLIAAAAGATAEDSLQDAAGDVARSLASADDIVAKAADSLVDPNSRSGFSDAIAATSATSEDVASVLQRNVDRGTFDKPFWTWELWSGAASLDARTDAVVGLAAALEAASAALQADEDALVNAALSLYGSVPDKASALEGANVSARAASVLDFRDAATRVAKLTGVSAYASDAFSALVAAADGLTASSSAELAEKAGSLYGTRIEIEAYARSISGGIVLDFDWAPVVNEMGGDWGIGGLADWNSDRGGFSTITFSNSVAEWWTADDAEAADARALVTHEVGHAISAKCYDRFDWESSAANEEWATAWAISMGHTAEGNGVEAYGYPSQAMIDAAATCR